MPDNIKDMIYSIRGVQVMLDADVAHFYQYETKVINQTVKRNINRFPEEFCFQITEGEYKDLLINRSQNVTGSKYMHRDLKYLPFVFTEKGIIMLAGLLKNTVAISVSLQIIEAFVEMRNFLLTNSTLFEKVINIENTMTNKFIDYDNNFDEIFNLLQKDQEFKEKIFYDGQIYDAYSLLINLIKSAKKEIVIIDNYIDNTILDLLIKKNNAVKVIIIGQNNLHLSELDIKKFNTQYPKLDTVYCDKYHDRFLIIDKNIIYHLGASLKDLGKKCFAISILEDKSLLDKI